MTVQLTIANFAVAEEEAATEVTFTEVSRGLVVRNRRATPANNELSDLRVNEASVGSEVAQPITRKLRVQPIEQPRLTLQRVDFQGNTVFTDEDLQEISRSYLNRPLRFSDLEQLRVDITRTYTDQGYLNSGALLPDQQVVDGVITYEIVEGSLDSIDISGNGRLRSSYVADRIRKGVGVPFNSKKLQESFQLLLDDPLIERMDGQLLPTVDAGRSRLRLKLTPAHPWSLDFTADNHGSPSVGSEQLGLNAGYLNPSGYGDRINLSLNVSPGRYSVSGAYSLPLSVRDTRITFDAGATNSTVVEEPLDDIDIESESTNLGVSLSHPLRRSLQRVFKVGADLTVRENSNFLLAQPFSFSAGEEDGESRVSALRIWQDYTRKTGNQVIALRSSFNFGVSAFGSTEHDDDRPDSEFVSWLGQAQFLRAFQDGDGQLLVRLDTQIANEPLLPLERFALGGAGSVRGYRKNQLVRDQAIFASAEYRYTFFNSAETGVWQVAPFVDYGNAQNRGSDGNESDSLFSVGAGLLWSKTRYNAELYIGHAIEEVAAGTDSNLQDDGVHFRFSTRFY